MAANSEEAPIEGLGARAADGGQHLVAISRPKRADFHPAPVSQMLDCGKLGGLWHGLQFPPEFAREEAVGFELRVSINDGRLAT